MQRNDKKYLIQQVSLIYRIKHNFVWQTFLDCLRYNKLTITVQIKINNSNGQYNNNKIKPKFGTQHHKYSTGCDGKILALITVVSFTST